MTVIQASGSGVQDASGQDAASKRHTAAAHLRSPNICVHIYIYLKRYVYSCVCTHVYVHEYSYVYIYIYICTYVCIFTYRTLHQPPSPDSGSVALTPP